MRENTIVVFTSDHGEWLGEHLRYGKGYPGHDVVSRVPMMVRWPERFPQAGETVSAIVEAVDVVPTLLELAGIQVPYEVQGKSFAGLLEGRTESHRDSALVEGPGWKGLRIDGFRYVVEKDGKESLFDLNKPLGDYENVAGEDAYASVLGEVRVELLRRLIEIERPIPREWAY
jgi:arylsulfatase A-like enzyme